jgi:hypothetical protein
MPYTIYQEQVIVLYTLDPTAPLSISCRLPLRPHVANLGPQLPSLGLGLTSTPFIIGCPPGRQNKRGAEGVMGTETPDPRLY